MCGLDLMVLVLIGVFTPRTVHTGEVYIPHNLQGLTQTQPMPNCTYTTRQNDWLLKRYIVEPYQGTLIMECQAQHNTEVITLGTVLFVANIAQNYNYTLSFSYDCNYVGAVNSQKSTGNLTHENVLSVALSNCYIHITEHNFATLTSFVTNTILARLENVV